MPIRIAIKNTHTKKIAHVGNKVEKLEPLCMAGEALWKTDDGSSKNQTENYHVTQQSHFWVCI